MRTRWTGVLISAALVLAPALGNAAPPLKGEAWSRQKVAQARNEGKTVFVNFHADWCVTCKLNDVLVFSSPRVQAALSAPGVKYLVADWTSKKDPAIKNELAYYGQDGLPMYLVFSPIERRPKKLPQVLSKKDVLRALNADPKK